MFDPWVWNIPWRGKCNPLHYSCLENPVDRETWQATVYGVAEESNVTFSVLRKQLDIGCCCSVTKLCLTICDPVDCSTPDCPSLSLGSLLKVISIESVMLFNHLILCYPLFLLPSIFPNIRVFSNELTLHIRWPTYWSFGFSISTSNEYSGSISFRMDWFDLLS